MGLAGIRHMGSEFVRSIGMASASKMMTLMAACDNLKRLTSFLQREGGCVLQSKALKDAAAFAMQQKHSKTEPKDPV